MQIISGDKILRKSEAGSTLLMTLIVFILLTVIGISGMNIVSTDLQITGNYKNYQENLYRADGAVMQLGQICENQTGSLEGKVSGEFTSSKAAYKAAQNSSRWNNDAISASSISDAQYMWTKASQFVASGASLKASAQKTYHNYLLYGRGTQGNGATIVGRGYRRIVKN